MTAGCSIVFVNDREEILLYRRDTKPGLPEPGKWDLLGGHIEPAESPEVAIVREVHEELGLRGEAESGIELTRYCFFRRYEFGDREEFTFWASLNSPAEDLLLFEGQELRWFSQTEIRRLGIAFGFERVLDDFYRAAPFRCG